MDKAIQFKGTIYENGYGMIAKKVITDVNLSIGAKALYSYICAYAGCDGGAFPARDRILRELKISKDSLSKYRKELVQNGYLSVEQKRMGGKFKSNVYSIVSCPKKADTGEVKSPCPSLSDTTEPCTTLSDTDKKDTTNIILYTNNNINTNNNNKDILSFSEKKAHDIPEEKKNDDIPYSKIIDHLNEMASKNYRASAKKTKDLIKARVNDGFKEEDFIKVINNKVATWKGNEMDMYLRPSTLFGTKFEEYLNENPNAKKKENVRYGQKKSSFNNYEQRKYDFKDLEKKLLGWQDRDEE